MRDLEGKTCERYACDRDAVGYVVVPDGEAYQEQFICQQHLWQMIEQHDPELAEKLEEARE